MFKRKVRKWKIEVELIDKGEIRLSIKKPDKYFYLARDIRSDLEYFLEKTGNPYKKYKIVKIRRIK